MIEATLDIFTGKLKISQGNKQNYLGASSFGGDFFKKLPVLWHQNLFQKSWTLGMASIILETTKQKDGGKTDNCWKESCSCLKSAQKTEVTLPPGWPVSKGWMYRVGRLTEEWVKVWREGNWAKGRLHIEPCEELKSFQLHFTSIHLACMVSRILNALMYHATSQPVNHFWTTSYCETEDLIIFFLVQSVTSGFLIIHQSSFKIHLLTPVAHEHICISDRNQLLDRKVMSKAVLISQGLTLTPHFCQNTEG